MDRTKSSSSSWSAGVFRAQTGTAPTGAASSGTASASGGSSAGSANLQPNTAGATNLASSALNVAQGTGRFSGAGAQQFGQAAYDVVIAPGCTAQGKLELKGRALVNARVEGELNNDVELVVGEQGDIEGNLTGTSIRVFGRVKGDISCSGRLELRSGAIVTGNLASPSLVIEDGVVFDGHCRMWDARGAAGQEIPATSRSDDDDGFDDDVAAG